jgi:uncharacterized phiE125 gp8 family phage protein
MPLILVTPPTGEPLDLAEVKTFLRLDASEDDVAVSDLIAAARTRIEAATGLSLMTQGWRLLLDDWPASGEIALPLAPIAEVDDVRVVGADEAAMTVDPAHYIADVASRPARLVLRSSRLWPKPGREALGIEIDVTTGYGDEPQSVPLALRQAVLHLVAEAYENREGGLRQALSGRLPPLVAELIAPYRRARL